ncbi:P-loop NTPase fold protein [Sphingomonas sp.]|uniref:P-loop NTPase fold protein n=1 Tax=Sphingomonas sp. TaxID=28214 RepID=UPI00389E659D
MAAPRFSRDLENTLHAALKAAEQRHHQYATLEHLLIALIDDPAAAKVMVACGVNRDELRNDVSAYLENDLKALDIRTTKNKKRKTKDDNAVLAAFDESGPVPTSTFQRVVQRAILHVQSSGRDEINGANVLVALFSERESYAVYFLQKQDISRLDAVTYVSHGVGKYEGEIPGEPEGARPVEIAERVNRVFRDDLKVIPDIIPQKPVLSTPRIAQKMTELAIDLIEQSSLSSASPEELSRSLITIGIYGPWGSGKSTLLRSLGKEMAINGFATVHINTWKWDGQEDIFTFMNRELLRSLSKVPSVKWRAIVIKVLLKIRYNLKRLSAWVSLIVGFVVTVLFVDWKAFSAEQFAKGTLAGILAAGLVTVLAKPAASLLEKLMLGEPHNIDARQSLSKSYRYLDFVRRFTRSKRRGPIVFLFDDLDRCDNKVVVDFIRSIHSLTCDGSLCVIACDEEFAAAAIYAQYKQVAEYIDEGKEFGRRFLEKIIQVPFRLPEVFKEDLREIGIMPISGISTPLASGDYVTDSAEVGTSDVTPDLGDKPDQPSVSEARLWEICGTILALVVEPAGLELRQAKMLSNVVKLYSMIFPPIDEISAERLVTFLIVNYVDRDWITSRYFDAPKKPSLLDPVEADLRMRLGDDPAALARLFRMLGFRRSAADLLARKEEPSGQAE